MGGENIANVVGSMGKKALDGASASIGIVDAVALDRQPPGFVKGRLVVGGVLAGYFHRLHEQRAGVFLAGQQHTAMPVDIGVEIFVEIKKVRQDQGARFRGSVSMISSNRIRS